MWIGLPVGISNLTIISSEISNIFLQSALKLFPWAEIKTFSDFLKNADNTNITTFFKNVQLVISNLEIENAGYRLITNSGENGGQEVPHFHIHILAGEKIGKLR